jgi:hypothetical protein
LCVMPLSSISNCSGKTKLRVAISCPTARNPVQVRAVVASTRRPSSVSRPKSVSRCTVKAAASQRSPGHARGPPPCAGTRFPDLPALALASLADADSI